MTPDELDAHEARHQQDRHGVCRTCEGLWPCASWQTAAALREAWEREARVRALIYASDDGTEYEHVPGCEGEPTCPACWAASIRQALAPVPFRALDGEA